ncbi:hypothetical protein PROFUN_05524 [Planoprotostelium fungivorum]|uniref:Clu domain-containing protein n=1 Tax=Planoprotostelium fungivorum TaxID=1890364 RepID=A0A2P6NR00_9EUKA|nr:hypothetical protein PROFUN_05524 [Planoprotostelium fungivorum]
MEAVLSSVETRRWLVGPDFLGKLERRGSGAAISPDASKFSLAITKRASGGIISNTNLASEAHPAKRRKRAHNMMDDNQREDPEDGGMCSPEDFSEPSTPGIFSSERMGTPNAEGNTPGLAASGTYRMFFQNNITEDPGIYSQSITLDTIDRLGRTISPTAAHRPSSRKKDFGTKYTCESKMPLPRYTEGKWLHAPKVEFSLAFDENKQTEIILRRRKILERVKNTGRYRKGMEVLSRQIAFADTQNWANLEQMLSEQNFNDENEEKALTNEEAEFGTREFGDEDGDDEDDGTNWYFANQPERVPRRSISSASSFDVASLISNGNATPPTPILKSLSQSVDGMKPIMGRVNGKLICWHGPNCHINNYRHTQKYYHPKAELNTSTSSLDVSMTTTTTTTNLTATGDSRPACRFGSSCRATAASHHREYYHPPALLPTSMMRMDNNTSSSDLDSPRKRSFSDRPNLTLSRSGNSSTGGTPQNTGTPQTRRNVVEVDMTDVSSPSPVATNIGTSGYIDQSEKNNSTESKPPQRRMSASSNSFRTLLGNRSATNLSSLGYTDTDPATTLGNTQPSTPNKALRAVMGPPSLMGKTPEETEPTSGYIEGGAAVPLPPPASAHMPTLPPTRVTVTPATPRTPVPAVVFARQEADSTGYLQDEGPQVPSVVTPPAARRGYSALRSGSDLPSYGNSAGYRQGDARPLTDSTQNAGSLSNSGAAVGNTPGNNGASTGNTMVPPRSVPRRTLQRTPSVAAYLVDEDEDQPSTASSTPNTLHPTLHRSVSIDSSRETRSRSGSIKLEDVMQKTREQATSNTSVLHRNRNSVQRQLSFGVSESEGEENDSIPPQNMFGRSSYQMEQVKLFNGELSVRNSYIVEDDPPPRKRTPAPNTSAPSILTSSKSFPNHLNLQALPPPIMDSPPEIISATPDKRNNIMRPSLQRTVSTPSGNRYSQTPTRPPPPSRPRPAANNNQLKRMLSCLNQDQLTELVVRMSSEGNMEDVLVDMLNSEDFLPDNPRNDTDGNKDAPFSWNDAFQDQIKAVREITSNTKQEDQIRIYEALAKHSQNFIYTATTYGKIIISEVALPPDQKTIKPFRTATEGAGGEKYLCKGIYFKFAVNSGGIYPGDEEAAKVAGHELKSLNQLFSLWIRDLHFPMMILLDYRGYRLIAMSTLPINEDTIVDAGRTIHTDNVTINEKIREIAQRLHLKEHKVGPKLAHKTISTPVDLEAHRGIDHRFYLLDFSRLFPPALPDGTRSAYLYKLFRPEFSSSYPVFLCSDGFSNFIKAHDPEAHNDEIREATEHLFGTVIPKFAEHLIELASETLPDYRSNFPSLLLSLHSHGINIRYLGRVRACLTGDTPGEAYWRFFILLEMLARTIKQWVRSDLRNTMVRLKQTGEEPYKAMVIRTLNILFGDHSMSTEEWNGTLRQKVKNKFAFGLTDEELSEGYDFKAAFSASLPDVIDGKCLLFKRITEQCGFSFSPTTKQAFEENEAVYRFQRPLDETDLEALDVRVKSMNIVQHSEGFILKLKASKRTEHESERLFHLAISKFKAAIESHSSNKVTLRNLGDCLMHIGNQIQAEKYFKDAIAADPRDSSTLWKFGMFNELVEKYDLAEECYLLSLEADLSHSNCSSVYADFLMSCRKNYYEADLFYQMSIATNPRNAYALNNYACYLTCVKRNFEAADRYYKMALIADREQPTHIRNYSAFTDRIKKLEDEAEQITRVAAEVEKRQVMRSNNLGKRLGDTYSTNEEEKEKKKTLTAAQKRNLRRKKIRALHRAGEDSGPNTPALSLSASYTYFPPDSLPNKLSFSEGGYNGGEETEEKEGTTSRVALRQRSASMGGPRRRPLDSEDDF